MIRRLKIGACVNEPGVFGDQVAQPAEVAGIERSDGSVKARVRFNLGEPVRRLDVPLEPGPVGKSILSGKHPLRVGQRERPVEDRFQRLAFHPG